MLSSRVLLFCIVFSHWPTDLISPYSSPSSRIPEKFMRSCNDKLNLHFDSGGSGVSRTSHRVQVVPGSTYHTLVEVKSGRTCPLPYLTLLPCADADADAARFKTVHCVMHVFFSM